MKRVLQSLFVAVLCFTLNADAMQLIAGRPVAAACTNTYVANDGTVFDGTNDYMNLGSGLTGAADGTDGIISLWFMVNGSSGSYHGWFRGTTSDNLTLHRMSDNTFRLIVEKADNTVLVTKYSNSTYTADSTWHHLLISWSTVATPVFHLYVDGVDDAKTGGTLAAGDGDYTEAGWYFGSYSSAQKADASFAEVYINLGEYLDFSVEANREKFIKCGKPVDLGATGSTPTGTAPSLYFPNGYATFEQDESGTSDDFTVTGALTDALTSPSD